MKLSEIHAAIAGGRGPALPEDQAFATMVAIERLAHIEGLPVSAVDFAAPSFGIEYPYESEDFRKAWRGYVQYLAWRNLILNAQMRFAPGDVDADPWLSLRRAERLLTGKKVARLYGISTQLPPGTHTREVTEVLLIKAYEEVPSKVRVQFRAGLNAFRRLFQNEFALRSGLLPDACPGPLPGLRDHRLLSRMSPEIEAWRNGFSDREVKCSLDYLNRLAIAGGLLNGKTDSLDDLRLALCDLPSPTEAGIPSIKPHMLRRYVSGVRGAIGGRDPRNTLAQQAWADLRTEARAAGCETSSLWALGKPAGSQNVFPREVTTTIAFGLMKSYSNRDMWSVFRHGCEQFDALRGKVPPTLLPPFSLGIQRAQRHLPRAPMPISLPDPTKNAWADFYVRLRGIGWNKGQLSRLSYLRVRAAAAGISPNGLNHVFIATLEQEIIEVADRTRLRAAVLCIKSLSGNPAFSGLPDLSSVADCRSTHGGLSPHAQSELEEIMEFMNAATSTRRALRVAVGVLTDAMGRPDIPLREILQTDMSEYDLGAHERLRKVHTAKIKNLREFTELPWTSAWRELQKVVAGTGVTAQDNPIPKVLSWIPGADPGGLSREWAQRLDRDLRSTVKNRPHGRADLAVTLARHVAAFDALHDIPAVAASGLLPDQIGPIR